MHLILTVILILTAFTAANDLIDTGAISDQLLGSKFYQHQSLAVSFKPRRKPHRINFSYAVIHLSGANLVRPAVITMRLCRSTDDGTLPRRVYNTGEENDPVSPELDCLEMNTRLLTPGSGVKKHTWRSRMKSRIDSGWRYFIVVESNAEYEREAPVWVMSQESNADVAVMFDGLWTAHEGTDGVGAYSLYVGARTDDALKITGREARMRVQQEEMDEEEQGQEEEQSSEREDTESEESDTESEDEGSVWNEGDD